MEHDGICMEYVWNMCGICMGYVWNMYGTGMCGRLRYDGEAVWYDGGMTDTLILPASLQSHHSDYVRNMHGIGMGYAWNRYGIHGICMEYLWNMYATCKK